MILPPKYALPLGLTLGKFAFATAVVFLPLMVLSDFAPGFALMWAGAAALILIVSWTEIANGGVQTAKGWIP